VETAGEQRRGALRGSGYLIGRSLVLTAGHVVVDPVEHCEVRALGTDRWLPGETVWRSVEPDAALLRLREPADVADGVPRLGELDRSAGEPVPCQAVGFPGFQRQAADRREAEQLQGEILPLSGSVSGLLTIQVLSGVPTAQGAISHWAGMAGAAVFVGDALVGVITQALEDFGGSRVLAVPISALLRDGRFEEALGGEGRFQLVRASANDGSGGLLRDAASLPQPKGERGPSGKPAPDEELLQEPSELAGDEEDASVQGATDDQMAKDATVGSAPEDTVTGDQMRASQSPRPEPPGAERSEAAGQEPTTVLPTTAGNPPSAFTSGDRWTVDDRLDYALYAKAIAEFIRHRDSTPPLVISVQAPWGQGKTSLMRMVQANLDPEHPDLLPAKSPGSVPKAVEPPSKITFGELRDALDGTHQIRAPAGAAVRTVWFNPWKYQSSEQIWAGFAHAILAQLPARLSDAQRELFWLNLQRRRIDPSAVRNDIYRAALERFLPLIASWVMLAPGVVIIAGLTLLAGGLDAVGAAITGAGVLAAVGVARRAWRAATTEVLKRPLEGAYVRWVRQPDHEKHLGYLHLVEDDMLRALHLLTPDDEPVVIFIDDLDRCSPEKVGEVLEAVNLFLAGDYPNCAFVLGIDAEMVAASMEVVHSEIIGRLSDRRGELGWRFMDKFVTLPFVMPRLSSDQRKAFLTGLMWTPPPENAERLNAEADALSREISMERLDVDESARRVGELAPKLAAVAPERARALGEQVVSAGANAFSDDDPEVSQALESQLHYLSDNPRTIKRAVNLYRFHRFAAFARQASTAELKVATPEQIGRWVVAIIRWPHFVRWLQVQRDDGGAGGEDAGSRAVELARAASTLESFNQALADAGIEASWGDEPELWEFLREETRPEFELHRATACGLW
jgi:hypothetical protein